MIAGSKLKGSTLVGILKIAKVIKQYKCIKSGRFGTQKKGDVIFHVPKEWGDV